MDEREKLWDQWYHLQQELNQLVNDTCFDCKGVLQNEYEFTKEDYKIYINNVSRHLSNWKSARQDLKELITKTTKFVQSNPSQQ